MTQIVLRHRRGLETTLTREILEDLSVTLRLTLWEGLSADLRRMHTLYE